MASVAILAATYFFVPQSAGPRQASVLPSTLTIASPSETEAMSPENAQLAAYATHSNLYMEPLSDSVAPQLVSHSMNLQSRD